MAILLLTLSFFIVFSTQCMEPPLVNAQSTKKLTVEYAKTFWQNNPHRKYQEDKITYAQLQNGHFFGVYDGHGSKRSDNNVSSFLQDNLHLLFEKSEKETIKEKLEDAFYNAETHVLANYDDGSTAVVAYIDATALLHLAWVGDSRALLEKNKSIDYKTNDHNPFSNTAEKERVLEHNLWIDEKKKHIKVYDIKKIGWNGLAMSRSIGDKNCKEVSSERPRGKGGIIAIPEYHVIQLTPENNFLIIATDGLWVKVTDTKAIQVITLADISLRQKLQLKANKTPPDFFDTSAECDESIIAAAHILGAKALIKGSHDNIAIIIVQLKWQEI